MIGACSQLKRFHWTWDGQEYEIAYAPDPDTYPVEAIVGVRVARVGGRAVALQVKLRRMLPDGTWGSTLTRLVGSDKWTAESNWSPEMVAVPAPYAVTGVGFTLPSGNNGVASIVQIADEFDEDGLVTGTTFNVPAGGGATQASALDGMVMTGIGQKQASGGSTQMLGRVAHSQPAPTHSRAARVAAESMSLRNIVSASAESDPEVRGNPAPSRINDSAGQP